MAPADESAIALHGDEVDALRAAVAQADPANAIFRVIDDIAVRRMAITVFSASTCFVESMELERIYSSRPDIYAQGARKSKRETRWGRLVMLDRQVFVGEGSLEMAAAFDDQERMESIGIHSIVNVPVVVRDRCAGVLAFGLGTERVRPADIVLARFLGLASSAAFSA